MSADLDTLISRARSHALGDIPRRSARRQPDKIAIVDGDVVLTFAEFEHLVDRAAAALCDNGFQPGDRVALLAHNCWQYAVLAFATARAAVVLVPINFMLTAEEIAYILGHSKVGGLLVEADLTPVAEHAMRLGGTVTTTAALVPPGRTAPAGWDDFAQWLTTTTAAPRPDIEDDQLLRLMYTSGTESRPKAAMHCSRSLMWQYVSTIMAGAMSGDDVEIHSLPLYHCAQLDNFLATDVYLGATSILLPRPDPELVLRTIEQYGVTNYFAPPTVWITCCAPRLRRGRPVQPAQGVLRRFGDAHRDPHRDPRPASPAAVVELLRPDRDGALGLGAGARRAGRARRFRRTPGDQRRDHHPRRRQRPGRAGTVGEIAHRSPHLMLGYLDDPAKTAEAFARRLVSLR